MSVLRILVSGDFSHFEERSILSYKGKQSYVMRSLVLFNPFSLPRASTNLLC